MVLRPLLLCVLAAGCIKRAPQARLAERTPVAVGYVFDRELERQVGEVPDAVRAQVDAALAERNLDPQDVAVNAEAFANVRETQQRFKQLAASTQAPWVVLVETRAQFFSQLSERYRWTVYAKVTIGRRGAPREPSTTSFDTAAFLDFDHEREPQALANAAPTLAKRVGALFDEVIAGEGVTPLPAQTLRPADDAVYFVMVDRFAKGDPTHVGVLDPGDPAGFAGGDLQGVLDHLDELQALGVRTLWLSPIFKMRTEKFFGHAAFHGYWVSDLNQVEPRFGDEALLRKLSDQLHARGMRLVLDMVLNHVAFDAPLVTQHPDWFHHQGKLEDWNDPEQLTQRDVHGLPDLAQEKPEVYRYLLESAQGWVRRVNPDGFRLDAVKHVPLAFWKRFNDQMHQSAGAGFWLLGELLEGDAAAVAGVEREGHFDAMFDFPLHFAMVDVFCRDQPPERLGAVMSLDRLYADPSSLVTLLDNHDLPRVMTSCRGEEQRVRDALVFQLTARGTPALTYGTEAGLEGAQEPENRRVMQFKQTGLRQVVTETLALRRAHTCLQDGVPWTLEVGRGLYAYARVSASEAAVIVVNRSGEARSIQLPSALGATQVAAAAGVTVSFVKPQAGSDFGPLTAELRRQWLTGAQRRSVEFAVKGPAGLEVAGSAPELGAWNPERALASRDGVARVELPVGSVVDFKLVLRKKGAMEWDKGENHSVFIREAAGPLKVDLAWSGS